MLTINLTMNEAFKIGKKCLDAIPVVQPSIDIPTGISTLPPQASEPIWKMNETALKNTLEYIYHLGTFCYMLCVTNGVPKIYKLAKTITPPRYAKTIRKSLKKGKSKTWRLMQCVLFEHKKQATFATEWLVFVKDMSLPNGVFILLLSDSVILNKTDDEPWNMVQTGKLQKKTEYIPILAYSGRTGFYDIPIPNFDDIQYAIKQKVPEFNTNWDTKKQVAVFRGSNTGCGYTAETNMRLKLSTMRSEDLDVGITSYTKKMRFDPVHGLGIADTKKYPLVPTMPMSEQANYKYIIHVDGNVAAYRLLTSMLTGSLILKVRGEYILWVDHLLEPGKHYIEIKEDLSDLNQKVAWCKSHDKECRAIAENSYNFARTALTKQYIDDSFRKILFSFFSAK